MNELTWSRSSGERYFGPVTWSPREKNSERIFGLHVRSDQEEGQGAYARLSVAGYTLLCRLPDWLIRPERVKHYLTSLTEKALKDHVARTGRDWYWETYPREYGFEFYKDTLHWQFGPQRNSWTRGERKTSGCWFYPWLQTRTVREDYFDTAGEFYSHKQRWNSDVPYETRKAKEAIVPVKKFAFKDYDGEIIVATLRLEEREVARGERGAWKWLSRIIPNKVYRHFDIAFSAEVGTEKGSWKGGTVGHSISSDDPAELHEAAFQRYCAEASADAQERGGNSRHHSEMTFLHEV